MFWVLENVLDFLVLVLGTQAEERQIRLLTGPGDRVVRNPDDLVGQAEVRHPLLRVIHHRGVFLEIFAEQAVVDIPQLPDGISLYLD